MKERKGHQVHHLIVSEQTKANDDCHNFFLKKHQHSCGDRGTPLVLNLPFI
jgi:hypothetical protein